MVNSISSVGPGSAIARAAGNVNDGDADDVGASKAGAATPPASGGAAADTVSLTPGAGSLPEALKAGPTVDSGKVSQLRDAIAQGNYPVNIDKLAQSILTSLKETR